MSCDSTLFKASTVPDVATEQRSDRVELTSAPREQVGENVEFALI